MPRFNKSKKRAPKEQSEFKEVVLKVDRVNRVVKGGRRLRFRVSVVIGNHKGTIGLGTGKSEEVSVSVKKAVAQAKKHLFKLQVVNDTIAHRVQSKFKGSSVLLLPASPGTGVIAGGAVRVIAELAGIKNLLSKSFGSNNKLNTAKAVFLALKELRLVEKAPGKTASTN